MACWDRTFLLLFQVHDISKLDMLQYISQGESILVLKERERKRERIILVSLLESVQLSTWITDKNRESFSESMQPSLTCTLKSICSPVQQNYFSWDEGNLSRGYDLIFYLSQNKLVSWYWCLSGLGGLLASKHKKDHMEIKKPQRNNRLIIKIVIL